MRTRRRLTWIVFGICALLVVEGLAWVTWQAVTWERRERRARADATFQESVVVALWRMDSELTPILGQESRRQWFEYRSFYNPSRTYTRMWQELQPGDVLVASPLLESPGPLIRLHFQVEPDGSVTSPQAPTGNMRDLAESQYVDSEFVVYNEQLLGQLTSMVAPPATRELAKLGAVSNRTLFAQGVDRPWERRDGLVLSAEAPESATPGEPRATPAQSTDSEYWARQELAQRALVPEEQSRKQRANTRGGDALLRAAAPPGAKAEADGPVNAAGAGLDEKNDAARSGRATELQGDDQAGARITANQPAPPVHAELEQNELVARWLSNPVNGQPELVLTRDVRVDARRFVQGFWMDWPAIRERLTAKVQDLLPGATLRPVPSGVAPSRSRTLASIPVIVEAGDVPISAGRLFTATHLTLGLTWLAVLGAIVAIAVVLRASMDLSDRRGRFVSAVTHELRTPLTTFCLYTEMLADGMVPDESSKRSYLDTLKGESRRLARIVENVLDFARLGQGKARANGSTEPVPAADLVERLLPIIRRRAEQGGMELVVEPADLGGLRVAADPQCVERILYNLVDNACKYAGDAADRRVHLAVRRVETTGGGPVLQIEVRDHGPGIPRGDRRGLFAPFHRARRDEQSAKSGLGLGLALSRGLARELGGSLTLADEPGEGATLRLLLPSHRTTA